MPRNIKFQSEGRLGAFLLIMLVWITPVWSEFISYNDAPLLTLQQALLMAEQGNLELQNTRLQVEKSQDDVAAAKTERLPKLEISAAGKHNFVRQGYTFDAGTFGDFPATGPIPAQDTTITSQQGVTGNFTASMSLPLVQQMRIGLAVDQTEVGVDLARQRMRSRTQDLEKQLKQLYYEILETQSGLAAVDDSIIYYGSLYELVSRYVQEQVALEYESMEVQVRLAKAKQESSILLNKLQTEKERLNLMLGRQPDTPFRVSSLPDSQSLLPQQQKMLDSALRQRPDINEARLQLEYEKLGKQMKKLEYLPDVDLRVHYSRLFNVELIPDEDAAVGLHARWNFYDWGRKQDELGKKSKAVRQAQNQLEQVEREVIIEVNSRIRKLLEARDQIRVSELGRAAAREKLRVITNKYREHAALLQDALHAESELSDANNDYNQAVLSLWTARADLEKALGED